MFCIALYGKSKIGPMGLEIEALGLKNLDIPRTSDTKH